MQKCCKALRDLAFLVLTVSYFLLAACSPNKSDDPDRDNPPVDQRPSNPNIDVYINGQITFDFVPHRPTNSALNFLLTEIRPSRGVTVQLLDQSGQLLREARTDANGNYSLGSPANISVRVRAIAELERADTASWQIRVTDNTEGNAVYAMQGNLNNSGTSDSTRNLHAASGWVDDEYNAPRVAAPFAILDAVYDALSLLESADPDVALTPAQIRWSTKNKAVQGSPARGEISTSYFDPTQGHIYLLGWADNDTDEYDRSVIVHEFAHLIEHQLSRSDNLGGNHAPNELLDMRIAFSEGWGNAFAGMAIRDPIYRDSFGSNQDLGFSFSVENIETSAPGWYSEGSVGNILFDLFDDIGEASDTLAAGFTPVLHTLTDAGFINSESFVGIHLFNEVLQQHLNINEQTDYASLLAQHNIYGQDRYGLNETNNGNATTLPLYLTANLGANVEVCTTNNFGEWNKLANRRYLLVDLPDTALRLVSISVTGRGGAYVEATVNVYRRGQKLKELLLATYNVDSETFTPTQAGLHVLEYYEENNVDEDSLSGGAYCATVSVN